MSPDRRSYQYLVGMSSLVMAVEFGWAIFDGWNTMPTGLLVVFLGACVVVATNAVREIGQRTNSGS